MKRGKSRGQAMLVIESLGPSHMPPTDHDLAGRLRGEYIGAIQTLTADIDDRVFGRDTSMGHMGDAEALLEVVRSLHNRPLHETPSEWPSETQGEAPNSLMPAIPTPRKRLRGEQEAQSTPA